MKQTLIISFIFFTSLLAKADGYYTVYDSQTNTEYIIEAKADGYYTVYDSQTKNIS